MGAQKSMPKITNPRTYHCFQSCKFSSTTSVTRIQSTSITIRMSYLILLLFQIKHLTIWNNSSHSYEFNSFGQWIHLLEEWKYTPAICGKRLSIGTFLKSVNNVKMVSFKAATFEKMKKKTTYKFFVIHIQSRYIFHSIIHSIKPLYQSDSILFLSFFRLFIFFFNLMNESKIKFSYTFTSYRTHIVCSVSAYIFHSWRAFVFILLQYPLLFNINFVICSLIK